MYFLQSVDSHRALFCVRLSLKISLSSKWCIFTPRSFLRGFCWVISEWWTSCPDPVQHSSEHSAETHELQRGPTGRSGGGESCTGSECQGLDSHDSFITLTATSPLLHASVQRDAELQSCRKTFRCINRRESAASHQQDNGVWCLHRPL